MFILKVYRRFKAESTVIITEIIRNILCRMYKKG